MGPREVSFFIPLVPCFCRFDKNKEREVFCLAMKIKYQLISCSGNPTAIIYGKYSRGIKNTINKKVFETNKNVEQIGYLYKLNNLYKFEMMGNEFSGNGCRAAGFSLLKTKPGKIEFTTSGTTRTIKVNVDNNQYSFCSIPYSFSNKKIIKSNLGFLIKMFGSYLLVLNKNGNENIANNIINQINRDFRNVNAVGIMFIKILSGKKISLNPYFYVKKTKTLINETSCGSGSVTSSLYLTNLYKKSLFNLKIIQPSKELIIVSNNYNSGLVNQITISGPTKIIGNYEIETDC